MLPVRHQLNWSRRHTKGTQKAPESKGKKITNQTEMMVPRMRNALDFVNYRVVTIKQQVADPLPTTFSPYLSSLIKK